MNIWTNIFGKENMETDKYGKEKETTHTFLKREILSKGRILKNTYQTLQLRQRTNWKTVPEI